MSKKKKKARSDGFNSNHIIPIRTWFQNNLSIPSDCLYDLLSKRNPHYFPLLQNKIRLVVPEDESIALALRVEVCSSQFVTFLTWPLIDSSKSCPSTMGINGFNRRYKKAIKSCLGQILKPVDPSDLNRQEEDVYHKVWKEMPKQLEELNNAYFSDSSLQLFTERRDSQNQIVLRCGPFLLSIFAFDEEWAEMIDSCRQKADYTTLTVSPKKFVIRPAESSPEKAYEMMLEAIVERLKDWCKEASDHYFQEQKSSLATQFYEVARETGTPFHHKEPHFEMGGVDLSMVMAALVNRQHDIIEWFSNHDLLWHLPLPREADLAVNLLQNGELSIQSEWVRWRGVFSDFDAGEIQVLEAVQKKMDSLNKPAVIQARDWLNSLLEQEAAKWKWSRQSGTGLLAGRGKFRLEERKTGRQHSYELKITSCKKDFETWKTEIQTFLTQATSTFDEAVKKEQTRMGLEAAEDIESLVERDILRYLLHVPYMRIDVLSRFLAGESYRSSHPMFLKKQLGSKYKGLLTSGQIKEYADRLDGLDLIRIRYLEEYGYHGGYTSIRILVKGKKALWALEAAELTYSEEVLLQKVAAKEALNDSQRAFLIEKMSHQNTPLSGTQMMALLDAMSSPGILAECFDRILALVRNGSSLLQTLARTRLMALPDGFLTFLKSKAGPDDLLILSATSGVFSSPGSYEKKTSAEEGSLDSTENKTELFTPDSGLS